MLTTEPLGITKFWAKLEGKDLTVKKDYTYTSCSDTVKLTSCFRVLEGDLVSLMSAFTWRSTPQGRSYWSNLYSNRETSSLSDEDRDYIEWLIHEYG